MSLELEWLKTNLKYEKMDFKRTILENIIKSLQRLESIENANPSEALECLEKIIDNLDDYADFEIKQEANEYIATIKQALLKAQELENTFADSHICEIQKEFAKYDKLCEETKCEECALGVGDGICLRKTFERKWELQKEVVSPNSVNLLMRELDCKDFAELRKYARCGYEKLNKKYLKWEDLEFNIEKQMMAVLLNGTKYTLIVGRNTHIDKLAFLRNGEINYYFLEDDKQFFNDLRLERVEE